MGGVCWECCALCDSVRGAVVVGEGVRGVMLCNA